MYGLILVIQLEVKCSRGHVRITADCKSRSHKFDTVPGNDMLFFFLSAMYTHAHQLPASAVQVQHIMYEAGYGDAVLQRLSKR